ncbi:class I adenylate-forming enzyme family protein [Vannielia litorea]|uniref:Acyl-CoA synthetase (AMP-forming)/AMP-acid ligase II n=1 Tax=Vannielia litorea TaxID=1217970 RepID=A0A1N6F948_9RHOB|nr:class I adenylate-forming enzyme family protein [Vannielia litorea]SIN91737.1 Acyl-CoA synthetase (AMP-forming)/AMP-acid ligase II [Vannielia litorea]
MLAPCPSPFNMAAYVLEAARENPGKTALVIAGPAKAQRWRYGEIRAHVAAIAAGLLGHGLQPGDRVLLRLGNTVEFPLAYLGALWAGLVPVPTSAALTVPEITAIAADLRPALVIAGAEVPLPAHPAPVLPEAALHEMEGEVAPQMGDPERLGYVIYTSGTSGRPRGVMHAHRAVWARRMMWEGWYDLREDDRMLHAGAFNWTYTLGTGLMDPWARGATAVIPAAGVKPEQLPLLMARHDATLFAAAPGVYRQMLRQVPEIRAPKLRHGLSAGEKLPEATRTAWTAATGTEIYEALGMSECSTYVSGSPARPAPEGASGYPQPGRRIRVGEDGHLAIHRSDPGLMLGYLDAPEETAARHDGDWFLTGDTVAEGPDGAITYLGRNDDMMNAGGYRVSPLEVEAAMTDHPGIIAAAAVEAEVKPGTTVIRCFYVGPEGIDESHLSDFAASRLARYKCPRVFTRIEALPSNANGKINRTLLRHRPLDPA